MLINHVQKELWWVGKPGLVAHHTGAGYSDEPSTERALVGGETRASCGAHEGGVKLKMLLPAAPKA